MKITKIAAVLLSLALVIGMFGYSTFSASAKYVPVQPPEDNTENPTGYCEETYTILPRSNYCYTDYEGIPNVNELGTVIYRAPEDLEIVSFQFALYRENTDLELVNYSSFTGQMAFNTNFDDDQVILKGSVSSLDPILVEEDVPILNLEFLSETRGKYDLYLEIEDLQVRTESGDKIIIQNGELVEPQTDPTQNTTEDPYEDPTGHCTDDAMYHLSGDSNYCPATPEFSGWDYGWHTLDFVAPEDLEILSLDFTLYHESSITTLDEYSAFSDEMVFEPGTDQVLLSGNFTSLDPVLVMKGESLLKTEISITTDYDTELVDMVYLSINNMTVKTADGERVIFKDGIRVDKNPIVFVGDVDKNGKVNINDATMLQRHLAEFTDAEGKSIIDEADTELVKRADANRDNMISVLDVTEIQRYVAEMIDRF